MEERPLLSCGVVKNIAFPDRYFLLDHKQIGLWVLPGGHIEEGDSPEYSLEKELFEEIGIQVKSATLLKKGHLEFEEDGKKQIREIHLYEVYNYRGIPYNKEPDQHHKLRSFTKSEIQKLIEEGSATDHLDFWLNR